MREGTTTLGPPAPVLPAAAQAESSKATPDGKADTAARGLEKPIEPQSSSSSIL